jgi:Mn2+/Fe2+ NRAMP family transporter
VLANRESLMGRFTNGRAYNVVAWATVAALTVLTLMLVVTSLWPGGALLPS